MLMAALVMGGLAAFYYGLRAGAWAAAATAAILTVAGFFPGMRIPAYLVIAAGGAAIQVLGSRRPRPPSSVLAVRWAHQRIRLLRMLVGSRKDR